MEGSVGASEAAPTNQNNSNRRTESQEMERKTEGKTDTEGLSRTEPMEVSLPADLARPSSAEHMDESPAPPGESSSIVNDVTVQGAVTAVTNDTQEQAVSGSTDRSDVDNSLCPKPDTQTCAADGNKDSVGAPDSQPDTAQSADTDAHNSVSELVSNSGVSAAVSSSGSDTAGQDNQTDQLKAEVSQSSEVVPPASENVSADSSSKLYPPLPSTSDKGSTPSATPSSSQTSSQPAVSSVPSTSSVQSEEGAAASKSSESQGESVYYIKWITFDGQKVPIITQNENGPCPLLAIMNVLLLKGKVRLAPMLEMVTSEQLMAYLGDCVFESMPQNLNDTTRANYEQNMQDAMAVMHKLQTGLDVNVKFTGVSDFEYTPECIIFDLLEIGLYHGWLVDPQDAQCVTAVGKCSYNQLVEKIIQQKASEKAELMHEALVAEQFLERTASQLTYHGLCELSSTVKEHELGIFFRNNHFSTLYRHKNELFVLVTDQGFLTESSVVWETLSNVDGDCHFVDANFCTFSRPEPSSEPIPNSPYASGDKQIDSDYQVALSLQQDQQLMAEQEAAWGQFHPEMAAAHQGDHELAMRLQEEEDRRAAAAMQEQRAQQGQVQAGAQGQVGAGGDRRQREVRDDRREKKDGKDCVIL